MESEETGPQTLDQKQITIPQFGAKRRCGTKSPTAKLSWLSYTSDL
jgi:hypothetical protein